MNICNNIQLIIRLILLAYLCAANTIELYCVKKHRNIAVPLLVNIVCSLYLLFAEVIMSRPQRSQRTVRHVEDSTIVNSEGRVRRGGVIITESSGSEITTIFLMRETRVIQT
ncbi:hypothetical protein N7541_000313 [Penicillium brevicompactum]|uniref:Uncharacterized protein n=1 Tax=Penicillium brevicompactum TaxID=5074 RepID=A0A9W9V2G3_PENBR|nr:hypothetical protein N7541_000313 [Penicillium brevicompactum]